MGDSAAGCMENNNLSSDFVPHITRIAKLMDSKVRERKIFYARSYQILRHFIKIHINSALYCVVQNDNGNERVVDSIFYFVHLRFNDLSVDKIAFFRRTVFW